MQQFVEENFPLNMGEGKRKGADWNSLCGVASFTPFSFFFFGCTLTFPNSALALENYFMIYHTHHCFIYFASVQNHCNLSQ